MKTCINCGAKSDRIHCPECGQKLEVRRVTWGNIADEISVYWLGFNTQFFRAVRALTIRPHKVFKTYLEGNRVRYIGPLGYLIIMSAFFILTFDYLGIDRAQYFERTQDQLFGDSLDTQDSSELILAMNQKLGEYIRLIPALNIPFFALGVWLFFRKRGYSYLENVAIMAYMQAHVMWLSIISLIIFSITDKQFIGLWWLLDLAYYVYGLSLFYYRKNYFITAIKSAVGYITGYIFVSLFFGIVGAIIGFIWANAQQQ